MKVVGLLSGGKDSCFNLCHCVAQGHEVIALASLRPEGGKEEIDSYLYQTVGQDGLHFIAEALELPLHRRAIQGTALDLGSDYASTSTGRKNGRVEGDETEDLYELLKEVMANHPDVQGVSVGAILSNYQRVRVEHVCSRLGLQSLAYLWQYDQSQLLEDMAAAGMECIIIKVAGAGLGLRHLGQNVCSPEMRNTLEILKNKWGTHPAGEGGEYETFTIDCPLFKKRIELTDTEQVVLSDSDPRYDIGTVAYLRLKNARLTPSRCIPIGDAQDSAKIALPALLDDKASVMLEQLRTLDTGTVTMANDAQRTSDLRITLPSTVKTSASGRWISIGNIEHFEGTPEEQVVACFQTVRGYLDQQGLDFLSISHINLYLATMVLFPSINAVYNTYFGPSPPTRACVASVLPSGCYVKMDVVAYKEQNDGERSALHVRGLSYWAPANIGPYSQAVRTGERLFVAGQIGLIPPTLSLPDPPSFEMEAALSSQHVRRIVQAVQEGTGGGFTGWMESCICWISGPSDTFNVKRDTVRKAWNVWRPEPDRLHQVSEVPMLIVQVPGLPKGAQVEWQVTWTTSQAPRSAEEDEDTQDVQRHFFTSGAFKEGEQQFLHTQKQVSGLSSVCITTIAGEPNLESTSSSVPVHVPSDAKQDDAYAIRAFHTLAEEEQSVISTASYLHGLEASVTTVAVLNLASLHVDFASMAFVALSEADPAKSLA